MSGGSTIVGPWPKREEEPLALTDVHAEAEANDWLHGGEAIEEYEPPVPAKSRSFVKWICVVAAISWVGFAIWTQYVALEAQLPTLAQVGAFAPILTLPLILIMLVWLAFGRSVDAEAERISKTIGDMRAEEARFGLIIESFQEKIDDARTKIAAQNDSLMTMGTDTAHRLVQIGEVFRTEVETISRQTTTLKASAAGARGDMAVLLATLPKAQVQARQMAVALQQAGTNAHEQAGALDAQLASVVARGREAEEVAGGAAQKLAAHLARMEGVSEVAGTRLAEAADQMTNAVDSALERAADALSHAREGMEAQGAAMLAMVEQGHAVMAKTGAESVEAVSARMADIHGRVDAIAKIFADQDELSQNMLNRISADLEKIEGRIGSLGPDTEATVQQAGAAMNALDAKMAALNSSLDAGTQTADAMIARAASLLTALDATAREIDETLPAAHQRFEELTTNAEATAMRVAPHITSLENSAAAALERLNEFEGLLTSQREDIEQLLASTDERLGHNRATAESLTQSLAGFEERARTLADTTGPQMLESLLRVKETAKQAAQHAKSAIEDVIPQSAASLSEHSRAAITNSITSQVEEQMAQITAVTEKAVEAAQKATDRLMQQMLTISETAVSLETRVVEAKTEIVRTDEGAFARRVGLMIESLNSTAIDVTKILSNEVTDTSWAAYLRGDRGIFTRRAVKLLEAGEEREIARNYDQDVEFRNHVNRYIHDFEAMIRHVLTSRDGGPLSVTLLSSDAGKLYVALAQAIDRLRS